ncbi:MAG: hypothetical protein ACWA6U_18005 [Breznakibacter sp.]
MRSLFQFGIILKKPIFAKVRLRIYSILLLLSFIVALSHEMIPHHHHALEEYVVSFQTHNTDHHHHHSDDGELFGHEEDSQDAEKENKHQHNFPFHHHLSSSEDFDYLRIDLNQKSVATFQVVAIHHSINLLIIVPPPEIDIIPYKEKPFFITSLFDPGATGLRAPPSIA